MRIGIIGAMPEEVQQIQTLFSSDAHYDVYAGRKYWHGKIFQTECVLAISNVGKVAASHTATALVIKYKPDAIISIGTAGALDTSLNIGDVVIADDLFQHDVDVRPFREQFEIPTIGKTFFTTCADLSNACKQAVLDFFGALYDSAIAHQLSTFNITEPKLVFGRIATGDMFLSVHQAKHRARILDVIENVRAAEMEAAAIAQVCHDFSIPFCAIKIISDKADSYARIDFMSFVENIAAFYGKEIISNLVSDYTC